MDAPVVRDFGLFVSARMGRFGVVLLTLLLHDSYDIPRRMFIYDYKLENEEHSDPFPSQYGR
jgi:hypothetical protein